jgi:hypothetical protein
VERAGKSPHGQRVDIVQASSSKVSDRLADVVDVVDTFAGGVDQLREHLDLGRIMYVPGGGVGVWVAVVHDRVVKQKQKQDACDFLACQARLKLA